MPRNDNVTRVALSLILLSFIAACATPRPKVPPPSITLPPPAPERDETAPTSQQPPAPPVSIGPRPEPGAEPGRAEPPPAPPPPTAPPVSPGQRGRFVVLNFDNADIETVIHAASEILGFNYVLAPDVKGKVTIQTSGRIPQEDVFGVLLAILEVHGFTAVKSGDIYKIVRIEGARERAVPTIIGSTADPNRTGDEVITQIVRVRFTSVNDLGTLLRPLISTRGTLITHRETNVLIITDTASNIRRLLDIVRLVDVEVVLEELQIIPIRYADAVDLATILNQFFLTGRGRPAAPGAPPLPAAPPTAPGTLRPPTAPTVTPGAEVGAAERPPLIIAERRSNSLIVHARRHELEAIKRLITQLDINIYGGRRVFIYYAENAKAKDLAATLNAIYGGGPQPQQQTTTPTTTPTLPPVPGRPGTTPTSPLYPPTTTPGFTPGYTPGLSLGGGAPTPIGEVGLVEGQVRFIADETTNAVIVTTFPRNWTEIEATIKQLDRMPRQVLVEVLVAEITLTDDLRLGIDWALKEGSFRFASQNISTASPSVISSIANFAIPPGGSGIGPLPAAGLTAFAFDPRIIFGILNTLATENRVNVLSNPHVLTTENKKAVINVSDSIPIVTAQQVPIGGTTTPTAQATTSVIGTQSVEYKDAGVILTVTPRIGEHGTVALDVKQEVNDIGNPEPPTGSRRIIKREAETSVVLTNNQTLVLGGLIRERQSIEDRGIPFLKNIPIIGLAFGAKVRTVTKTELLILITPRVLGTAVDAARLTEQMRRATPELDQSIRRAPRQPTPPPAPLPPSAPPSP